MDICNGECQRPLLGHALRQRETAGPIGQNPTSKVGGDPLCAVPAGGCLSLVGGLGAFISRANRC